jgi:hypothetical protein
MLPGYTGEDGFYNWSMNWQCHPDTEVAACEVVALSLGGSNASRQEIISAVPL